MSDSHLVVRIPPLHAAAGLAPGAAKRALAYVRTLRGWLVRQHRQDEGCQCPDCDAGRAEAAATEAEDLPEARITRAAARRRHDSALRARRGDWGWAP